MIWSDIIIILQCIYCIILTVNKNGFKKCTKPKSCGSKTDDKLYYEQSVFDEQYVEKSKKIYINNFGSFGFMICSVKRCIYCLLLKTYPA